MRKTPAIALSALLAVSAGVSAQQPAGTDNKTPPPTTAWELKPGGQWLPTNAPATRPVVSDDTLDRVEEMLKNNQPDAAHKICLGWIRSHQQSPIRDRGVYLLGMANFMNGDRIEAFYEFDEILDRYPSSRYFYPALQQQYVIADQFLKGYKLRFLGLPILDATTEATEILYRIQERAPGSPLAEKSLLRVADYYYANSDFDIAADAYAAYVRSYPKSPHIPRVRLREAFSSLAQFRGTRFDATPIVDARQQLLNIARLYPDLADKENVAALITRIDASLADKLLETAAWYKRTHRPTASAYYYQYLILQYPDSPQAAEARKRLSQLPPEALKAPTPPVTRPVTLPADPETESK